jgi:tetratricopeptide (TPR) repeat protein
MSAEQFAGRRTDARTDQFSFCAALYRALYGVHPFDDTQLGTLIASVAAGRVLPSPATSTVPPWLRRVLLRGLSANPDDRYPSMTELLAALGREQELRRRRRLVLGAGALLVAVLAAGAQRLATRQRLTCDGGATHSATAWTPARREAIEKAFAATGSRHAVQAFTGAAALIDRYVTSWTGQFKQSCEATHVRGEQSTDMLDLRMACLNERLASVRALADTFVSADAKMVDQAIIAAGALPALEPCSDIAALRAIVKPPDDPVKRRLVVDLREQLATVHALRSAGRCDQAMRLGRPLLESARQLGYLPLQAESSYALGRMFDTCSDPRQALVDLEDAVMAAEASRHDAVAIEAAAMLASAYADRTDSARAARQWLRLAEAMLARFPGHPVLEARVTASRSIVLRREGRLEDALVVSQRAVVLQEALLGPTSPDVAISHNNIAVILHDLGRDQEAEAAIRRCADIIRGTIGDDTHQFALASINEAEILTELGKHDAARAAIERGLAIWRQQAASDFLIGYGLLDQGKLELAERRPRSAIATLEKALSLLEGQDARYHRRDPVRAGTRAGRRIVRQPRARGRPRRQGPRAVGDDPSAARLVRNIDSWQRDHARDGSSNEVSRGARHQ